ncbi:MAG: S9 family peptidase [Ilumatobacteraceae bacterium]|nr:S9 family peptidase [Ilumatobacteraceae bacterium]
MTDSFPRQYARTQRFTLGRPRTITVSSDGRRVIFLRSAAGDDPVNALWVLDVETGHERCVADPRVLLSDPTDDALPAAERARRERTREGAGGITGYATDAAATVVAFALGGRLFVGGLLSGGVRELDVPGPVIDPRPDPHARRVAYVRGADLCIAELDGRVRTVASGADTIAWGSADFIAAEEMHRFRGYWWSPDGSQLLATRVDDAAVDRWTIADPAHPERPPTTVAYPAAGTSNASTTLHLIDTAEGSSTEVRWPADEMPYVAAVDWSASGLAIQVESRDQRRAEVRTVDITTGSTAIVFADVDDAWVELVPGSPRLIDGQVLVAADRGGARRLLLDGTPITPNDLQVRAILAAAEHRVVYTANPIDDATSRHVWVCEDGHNRALTTADGIHDVVVGGCTTVTTSASLTSAAVISTVTDGAGTSIELTANNESPTIEPNASIFHAPPRAVATAVLLPRHHDGGPLPVLLDPYGGPHALRVQRAAGAFVASQWFADQGFAVVVADGRGTPGRGSEWERAVLDDLATPALDDQVDALHAAAQRHPELDLERVAIRGWSFGGYLAALAVLRRPDVFHAAIAGAPVTEWRLYDTHYTERYLGDPNEQPGVYDDSSLLPLADRLERPLLLIHGLADDNVVAAHTLQLSSALLAAGRPHEVLPLVGVSHMTPQEVVAENLLLHQLDFLRRTLGDSPTPP